MDKLLCLTLVNWSKGLNTQLIISMVWWSWIYIRRFFGLFFTFKIVLLYNVIVHCSLLRDVLVNSNMFLIYLLAPLLHQEMTKEVNAMHNNECSGNVSKFSKGEWFLKDTSFMQEVEGEWHVAPWSNEHPVFDGEALLNSVHFAVLDTPTHDSLDVCPVLPSLIFRQLFCLIPNAINFCNPEGSFLLLLISHSSVKF